MKAIRQPLMLAATLATALALSACGKSNEPASPVPSAPPPSATTMAPPMTPPMTPPPSSTAAMPASAAVSVSSVEIGSSVDANNKILASGTSFAPQDKIYASVETVGNGHATLAARWTYQDGQTVHEDSKVLDTMGPESTAFMISKPSGFPEGTYKVEISLDGQQVASKDFSVKK